MHKALHFVLPTGSDNMQVAPTTWRWIGVMVCHNTNKY